MYAHHHRTIDRLIQVFQDDPAFLGLIVGGSIARGWEREDSDVDIVLVATDAEYARRAPANDLHYFTRELCDYDGGYVDGKVVNRAYLEEVAGHGSEPARAAFVGAWLACARDPILAGLLERIPVYPEAERPERLRSFYAQVLVWQWYLREAEKRRDPYLLQHSAVSLALFAGRLILAHNRVLYPYHKWFMATLRAAPDKPPTLVRLIERLLAEPGRANGDALVDAVKGFTAWDPPPEGWPTRFMLDSEWAWRRGPPPIADC